MKGAWTEVTIDKPADEVWAVIGDFGNVSWTRTPSRCSSTVTSAPSSSVTAS